MPTFFRICSDQRTLAKLKHDPRNDIYIIFVLSISDGCFVQVGDKLNAIKAHRLWFRLLSETRTKFKDVSIVRVGSYFPEGFVNVMVDARAEADAKARAPKSKTKAKARAPKSKTKAEARASRRQNRQLDARLNAAFERPNRDGDWFCAYCYFANNDDKEKACMVCSHPRPAQTRGRIANNTCAITACSILTGAPRGLIVQKLHEKGSPRLLRDMDANATLGTEVFTIIGKEWGMRFGLYFYSSNSRRSFLASKGSERPTRVYELRWEASGLTFEQTTRLPGNPLISRQLFEGRVVTGHWEPVRDTHARGNITEVPLPWRYPSFYTPETIAALY